MKKQILFFFIALSFFGCVSEPQPPKWVVNVPQDNNQSFYGGAGAFTKEGAIKQALNNIASRLNVIISSNLLISKGIFKNKNYNDVSQEINAAVYNIHFNNYKILKTKKNGNQIYVLVEVNKNKLKQQLETSIELNLKKVNDLLSKIPFPIQKIQHSYLAIKLINHIKRQILMLQTLNVDTSSYIKQLTKLAKKSNYYLKHIKFSIKTNHFKEVITDIFSKYLNISKNNNLIYINIKLKKDYILKQYLICGKAYINFQGHKTLTIRFTGSSYISFKGALFSSEKDFRKKLDKKIQQLLNINN